MRKGLIALALVLALSLTLFLGNAALASGFKMRFTSDCSNYIYIYERKSDLPDNVSWFVQSWSYIGRVKSGSELSPGWGPSSNTFGSFTEYKSQTSPGGSLLELQRVSVSQAEYTSGGSKSVSFDVCSGGRWR